MKSTGYRINFFPSVMFRLSVLLLNSMSKLIHNRCTCKLIIKPLRLLTCMQNEQLCLCFYVLIPYSLLFSSEIILKTIIPLRLSEYCRIIPSTSSRGLFDNIHFAFGELLLIMIIAEILVRSLANFHCQ